MCSDKKPLFFRYYLARIEIVAKNSQILRYYKMDVHIIANDRHSRIIAKKQNSNSDKKSPYKQGIWQGDALLYSVMPPGSERRDVSRWSGFALNDLRYTKTIDCSASLSQSTKTIRNPCYRTTSSWFWSSK